jgi:peptidoglycan/LPS O-acetylase OafA/YrhL
MMQRRLRYSPALDGLRAVAVSLVLLEHAAVSSYFRRIGTAGVIVFFVLSGYLITRLLSEEQDGAGEVSFRNFYARRFLRLLPALLAMLAVFGLLSRSEPRLSTPIIWPLLYLSNIVQASGHTLGILGHTWSLATEEQFYLAWPVVLVVSLRRGDRRLAARVAATGAVLSYAITVAVIVRGGVGANWIRVSEAPDTMAMYLLFGCVLALTESWWLQHVVRPRHVWVAAAAVALVPIALSAGTGPFWLLGLPLVALAAGVLVLGAVNLRLPSAVTRSLTLPPVVGVGRISYGLYLWHSPVYALVGVTFETMPGRLAVPVRIVGSLAVAVVSYFVVERPALALKARFPNAAQRVERSATSQ